MFFWSSPIISFFPSQPYYKSSKAFWWPLGPFGALILRAFKAFSSLGVSIGIGRSIYYTHLYGFFYNILSLFCFLRTNSLSLTSQASLTSLASLTAGHSRLYLRRSKRIILGPLSCLFSSQINSFDGNNPASRIHLGPGPRGLNIKAFRFLLPSTTRRFY